MMEKRNVATDRRLVDRADDIEDAACMFSDGIRKKAEDNAACAADEAADEDTGTGDRRK